MLSLFYLYKGWGQPTVSFFVFFLFLNVTKRNVSKGEMQKERDFKIKKFTKKKYGELFEKISICAYIKWINRNLGIKIL